MMMDKPTIHRAMPDDEYRALSGLSHSGLLHWITPSKIDPRNAIVGSAFHAMMLEPDIAAERIDTCTHRRNSKKWKAHVESNPDKWVLTKGETEMLDGMDDSVADHPQLSRLRDMAHADRDRCELVLVWTDEETGLTLKAKADQVTDRAMYDWKTTGSQPDGFGQSIGAFNYHTQAAFYLAGAQACGLELDTFRFVPVCKRADFGHVCWIQDIDCGMMAAGRATLRNLLTLYARYGKDDHADQ